MPSSKKSKKSSDKQQKSKTVVVDGQELTLEESLDKAKMALETSQRQLLALHRSWRSQLQRLSLLALFLILKQSSIPAYDCLDQIEEHNDKITTNNNMDHNNSDDNKTATIGDWETALYVLGDSKMEVFSVTCCLCLLWLLHQQSGDDFSSLPFQLCVLLVPLIVGSYYSDPTVGCLEFDDHEENTEAKPRTFPVTLILLVVCFGSLYTMQYQQTQERQNLQKVQKLKDDLLGTKKEK